MSILSDKDPYGWPMSRFLFLFLLSISGIPKFVNKEKIQKIIKTMAHVNTKHGKKITNKNKGGGGVSICSVWSLTHYHSWHILPCNHQQFSIIATFYRPPATTISYSTTTSSPEKKKTSSNRLGTPLSRGAEKPEGPSAPQPTTESFHKCRWPFSFKSIEIFHNISTPI